MIWLLVYFIFWLKSASFSLHCSRYGKSKYFVLNLMYEIYLSELVAFIEIERLVLHRRWGWKVAMSSKIPNDSNDDELAFIKFFLATKMSLLKSDVTKQSLEWKMKNGKRILICTLCKHEYGISATTRSDDGNSI